MVAWAIMVTGETDIYLEIELRGLRDSHIMGSERRKERPRDECSFIHGMMTVIH